MYGIYNFEYKSMHKSLVIAKLNRVSFIKYSICFNLSELQFYIMCMLFKTYPFLS